MRCAIYTAGYRNGTLDRVRYLLRTSLTQDAPRTKMVRSIVPGIFSKNLNFFPAEPPGAAEVEPVVPNRFNAGTSCVPHARSRSR